MTQKNMRKSKSNFKTQQLKSFLDISPTVNNKPKIAQQEFEQYLQENAVCYICSKILGQKRKKCGFCNFSFCSDHLRKKRKNKGKFERICDNCQDKFLFQSYMKFQMKAEQSLVIQQQIVKMKYESFKDQLEAKNIKLNSLKQDRVQNQRSFQTNLQQLKNKQNSINQKLSQLNKYEQQLNLQNTQIEQLQKILPRALEEDFKMMQKQDDKLTKDLSKLQKRCQEIKISIQKKQKQLQNEFKNWQARVSRDDKKLKEEKCMLF